VTGGIVLEMVEVIATASGDKPEDEPVAPGGPNKGPRRHAARTGKTAREADKKKKAAAKKAKKGGPPPSGKAGAKKAPAKADGGKPKGGKPKKTGKPARKANAKPKT
jgi:hypothetical protein